MNLPLLAVDVKSADFAWTANAEPEPAPAPSLPSMKISLTAISADELLANVEAYTKELLRQPNWRSKLKKRNLARREDRKLKSKAA